MLKYFFFSLPHHHHHPFTVLGSSKVEIVKYGILCRIEKWHLFTSQPKSHKMASRETIKSTVWNYLTALRLGMPTSPASTTVDLTLNNRTTLLILHSPALFACLFLVFTFSLMLHKWGTGTQSTASVFLCPQNPRVVWPGRILLLVFIQPKIARQVNVAIAKGVLLSLWDLNCSVNRLEKWCSVRI